MNARVGVLCSWARMAAFGVDSVPYLGGRSHGCTRLLCVCMHWTGLEWNHVRKTKREEMSQDKTRQATSIRKVGHSMLLQGYDIVVGLVTIITGCSYRHEWVSLSFTGRI